MENVINILAFIAGGLAYIITRKIINNIFDEKIKQGHDPQKMTHIKILVKISISVIVIILLLTT